MALKLTLNQDLSLAGRAKLLTKRAPLASRFDQRHNNRFLEHLRRSADHVLAVPLVQIFFFAKT